MGINQQKQEAKLLKQAHQEAGHIEDENIFQQRRQTLNDWRQAKKESGREAAAQRHLEKAELALQQRARKHK